MERNGTDVVDLINGLEEDDIRKLHGAIQYPARLSEKYDTPAKFILNVNSWEGYNPELFLEALSRVNPTLVPKAENISFLMTPPLPDEATDEESREMSRLVRILREDITNTEWNIIFKINGCEFGDEFDFQRISEFCLHKNIISKDFKLLKRNLKNVKRLDLAQTISVLQVKFSSLTNPELKNNFTKEYKKYEKYDLTNAQMQFIKKL